MAAALADGQPKQDRHPPARPLRDVLQPFQLARRFDRDRPDAGRDCGAVLLLAFARPGEDHMARFEPRALHELQLAQGRDVRAEAHRRQMGHDSQRRIGLDGVGQVEDRRQNGAQPARLQQAVLLCGQAPQAG